MKGFWECTIVDSEDIFGPQYFHTEDEVDAMVDEYNAWRPHENPTIHIQYFNENEAWECAIVTDVNTLHGPWYFRDEEGADCRIRNFIEDFLKKKGKLTHAWIHKHNLKNYFDDVDMTIYHEVGFYAILDAIGSKRMRVYHQRVNKECVFPVYGKTFKEKYKSRSFL